MSKAEDEIKGIQYIEDEELIDELKRCHSKGSHAVFVEGPNRFFLTTDHNVYSGVFDRFKRFGYGVGWIDLNKENGVIQGIDVAFEK